LGLSKSFFIIKLPTFFITMLVKQIPEKKHVNNARTDALIKHTIAIRK